MATIRLRPEALARHMRKTMHGNEPVVLSLSAYDVPMSMTMDKSEGGYELRFEYADHEPAIDHVVDNDLTVQLGKHSGKVLGFYVRPTKTPKDIKVRIVEGVEQELAGTLRDNQRLNYQLVKEVVSTEMDELIAEVGGGR